MKKSTIRIWRERLRRAWRRADLVSKEPINWLDKLVVLYRVCVRRSWEHNITAMSAALSFRTIFALVPLLVLAFLILKSVGALDTGKQSLRTVLEASGFSKIALPSEEESPSTVPADEPAGSHRVSVADEIERLVEGVESKLTIGRVGPIGFVLLIYTATTLLTSMERSLNRIFGAPRGRTLARGLIVYWAVLTLGPILIVVANYVAITATNTLDNVTGLSRFLVGFSSWAAPLVGGVLVLWTVYKLLPNTEVSTGAAIVGAATAGPLWLIAKWGFSFYVDRFVSTGNLYGAIGVVPLFLVWLNLSWMIVLYGAQVAHTVASRADLSLFSEVEAAGLRPPDLLAAALAVARPYAAGEGPVPLRSVANQLKMTDESLCILLDRLIEQGILCRTGEADEPRYLPARPLESISAAQVLQLTAFDDPANAGRYDDEILSSLTTFDERTGGALRDITLADFAPRK